MKLLVAALEKRKFAVTERPRNPAETFARGCAQSAATSPPIASPDLEPPQRVSSSKVDPSPTGAPRQRVSSSKVDPPPTGAPRRRVASSEGDPPTGTPRQRVASSEVDPPPTGAPRQRVTSSKVDPPPTGTPRRRVASSEVDPPTGAPRQRAVAPEADEALVGTLRQPVGRSRYIPAGIRREVYRRDDARCTYVDVRGRRCCETHYLELHHLLAFAKGGGHMASNLTLRCAAHNALAVEADFGRRRIADRRSSTRHEALAAHEHNAFVGPIAGKARVAPSLVSCPRPAGRVGKRRGPTLRTDPRSSLRGRARRA